MKADDDGARTMLMALLHEAGDTLHNGIEELSARDRLFLITTCAARMIEKALCERANYDEAGALQGLDALIGDMREQIAERCNQCRRFV